MECDWKTASQVIGTAHTEPSRTRRTRSQPPAGVSTAAAAYASAGNDFPRFERQMIRTIYDEDISSGVNRPHSSLLQQYPNREVIPDASQRPGSGRSGRSQRSGRSGRSSASHRSAAASFAGSAISGASSRRVPPGYFRPPHPPRDRYDTANQVYGAGGKVAPEPEAGREAWMLGRGGGQISSFDNCLVRKHHH